MSSLHGFTIARSTVSATSSSSSWARLLASTKRRRASASSPSLRRPTLPSSVSGAHASYPDSPGLLSNARSFKINAFLFSPFGRRILKDVLAYHVVPDISFFTDYENGLPEPKSIEQRWIDLEEIETETLNGGIEIHPGHHGHADVAHYELPTLLGDQKIRASVFTYRLGFGHGPLFRRMVVQPEVGDEKPVLIPDVPVFVRSRASLMLRKLIIGAQGGAIHALGSVLRPSLKHHEHGHEHFNEL